MRLMRDVYMVGSGQLGLSDPIDCHIYLLDGGDELALIDAGVGRDPEQILINIRDELPGRPVNEGAISTIFLTHSHADHAGGVGYLRQATGARIACSRVEGRLLAQGSEAEMGLDRAKRSGVYPLDYRYPHVEPDMIVEPARPMALGRYTVRGIEVPGHSLGSLCYLVEGEGARILFSGDTVFYGGTIGLGNWAGSSLEDYRRCLNRLSGLRVEALFPGHFLWTLRDGQTHLDRAVQNMEMAWVPPAWQHQYPHR